MLRSILLLAAATTASSSAKPNVLVLFADDMGHADLGVYGAPTTSTPNLDKLANEGVRFTAWYSGFHICSPSRAAMMTGRLCVRSGTCGAGWLGGVFGNAPVAGLPTNETTFATALSTAGYATAAMGKWHLGTKDEYMPTSHGFDQYFGIPYSVDMGKSAWRKDGAFPPLPLVHTTSVIEQPVDLNTLSKRYAKYADGFIANATANKKPWLLYLAFQHVHIPDFVSPEFCMQSRRGLFGDAVEELDWLAGQVIGSVNQHGARENTITFFSSDNGPWTIEHLAGGSAGPFRDGKGSVWEGGVREPGIVHWPGTILPRIESEPVATYDIFPTVLKLAGVPLPADREFDGKDMMPLLTTPGATSAHDATCIFYWKGCSNNKWCGVHAEESPLVNKATPGLWAVRCARYKTHFVATNESCTVHYMPKGYYQTTPLIYRIDEDPSERFPLDPVLNKQEFDAQLKIATEAVTKHIASLDEVVNQIGRGEDSRIRQNGGSAFCGCPNQTFTSSAKPSCLCDPANMNAFVCPSDRTPNFTTAATRWGGETSDVLRRRQLSTDAVFFHASSSSSSEEKTGQKTEEHPKQPLSAAAGAKPNVIMFFVDDSGYGDWGMNGSPSTQTPHVDALAAGGARFTQWYTAHAICTPSRAALMTGRLPIRYGLASTSSGGQSVFVCRSDMGLPKSEMTMAEMLKKEGYRTHMIGKWHLGSVPSALPCQHGFDTYFGIPFSVDMGFAYNNRTEESWSEGGGYYGCTPLPLMENNTVVEQPVNLATVNARYTASATNFIATASASKTKTPWFMYMAFGHVHTPQYAGAAQAGKSKRGIFGDSVAEVDTSIGHVMAALTAAGVERNTLVLFSSDNGAPDAHQHNQPGQQLEAYTGSNHMFTGSKTQTWEGGIREPGLAWWPGVIAPQVRHELVSTLDVFATVAHAAGAVLPADRIYDSFSMLPLLTVADDDASTAVTQRNASFFYAGATLNAVRVGPYKAHLVTVMPNEGHAGPERGFLPQSGNDHSPYGKQAEWLLFNVEFDPSEMFEITDRQGAKAILAEMKPYVDAHLAALGTPPTGILDHLCPKMAGSPYGACELCCDEAKKCVCSPPPKVLTLVGACHGGVCGEL